jgi:hypothetical protein
MLNNGISGLMKVSPLPLSPKLSLQKKQFTPEIQHGLYLYYSVAGGTLYALVSLVS